MIRFVLGMAPVTLMGCALWKYRESTAGEDDSTAWVRHTIAAQRLADRIARDAGCDPDPRSLAKTLEAFAVATGDNPSQVRAARAIREAVARGDLRAIGPIADAASDEEARLLDDRRAADAEGRAKSRGLADTVFALGFAMSSLLLLMAFTLRATAPPARRAAP